MGSVDCVRLFGRGGTLLVALATGIGALTRFGLLCRLRSSTPQRSTADPLDPSAGPEVRGDGGIGGGARLLGRALRVEAAVLILVVLVSTVPVSPPADTLGAGESADALDAPGAGLVADLTSDWEPTPLRFSAGRMHSASS